MPQSGLVAERIRTFQAATSGGARPTRRKPSSPSTSTSYPDINLSVLETNSSELSLILDEKLCDISGIAVETSYVVGAEVTERVKDQMGPCIDTKDEDKTKNQIEHKATSTATTDDNVLAEETHQCTNKMPGQLVVEIASPLCSVVPSPERPNVEAPLSSQQENIATEGEGAQLDPTLPITVPPPPPPPVSQPGNNEVIELDDSEESTIPASVHSVSTEETDVVANKVDHKASNKKVTFERSPIAHAPITENGILAKKLKQDVVGSRRRRPHSPHSYDSRESLSSASGKVGRRDIMDAIFDYFDVPIDSDDDESTIFSEESSRISGATPGSSANIRRTGSLGSTFSMGAFPARSFDEMWENLAENQEKADKESTRKSSSKSQESSDIFKMIWDFIGAKSVDLDALCTTTQQHNKDDDIVAKESAGFATVQAKAAATVQQVTESLKTFIEQRDSTNLQTNIDMSSAQVRATAAMQHVSNSLKHFVEKAEASDLPERTQNATLKLAEDVRYQIERNFSELSFEPPVEQARPKYSSQDETQTVSPLHKPLDSSSPVGVDDWHVFDGSPFKSSRSEIESSMENSSVARQLFQNTTLTSLESLSPKNDITQRFPGNRSSSLPAQSTGNKLLVQTASLRPTTSFKVAPQMEGLFSNGDDEFQNFDAEGFVPTRIDV